MRYAIVVLMATMALGAAGCETLNYDDVEDARDNYMETQREIDASWAEQAADQRAAQAHQDSLDTQAAIRSAAPQ